jgi:hypothetical protein
LNSQTSLTKAEIGQALMHLRRDKPWHELARMLYLLLGNELYSPPDARAEIGRTCGLSAGVVGRYLSAYRRIVGIAREKGVPEERLLSSSFNGCEVACRLYERSPAQGLASLLALGEGSETLSTVRKRLATIEAPADSGSAARGDVLRRRGAEIKALEKALVGSAERLFGRGTSIRRRPSMRFFRRVGFEAVARDGAVVAGLDYLAPHSDQQRDELDAGFGASALLSTYFPRFHYVTSPEAGADIAARAVETLAHFGLRWFGVMNVDPGGEIEVLRAAKGRPNPDRTAEYEALKARYAVGRRAD